MNLFNPNSNHRIVCFTIEAPMRVSCPIAWSTPLPRHTKSVVVLSVVHRIAVAFCRVIQVDLCHLKLRVLLSLMLTLACFLILLKSSNFFLASKEDHSDRTLVFHLPIAFRNTTWLHPDRRQQTFGIERLLGNGLGAPYLCRQTTCPAYIAMDREANREIPPCGRFCLSIPSSLIFSSR